MTLRLSTAGESHGPALVAILTGLPAGLVVDRGAIDADLKRRQEGYGRSPRQQIEQDRVEVLAGLRDALERASARHTAVHVAAGAVAKALLAAIEIGVEGSVVDEEGLRARIDA